jgi:hypothetical protein
MPTSDSTSGGSIAIGSSALSGQTVGSTNYLNTAIGYQAMAGTMSNQAVQNVAVGYQALNTVTDASGNVGVGSQALFNLTTGTHNATLGANSLRAVNSGLNNTAVGYGVAGTTLTTGSQNIFIGVDPSTDAPTASTNNWMNIGNAIYGKNLKNNTNTTGVPQIAIGTGLTTVTAGAVLDLSSNTTSTNSTLVLPVGTSAARPGTGVNGMIRYNTTTNQPEGFFNGVWTSFASSGGSAGNLGTAVTTESPQISGDATSGFYTPGASTTATGAGGIEVMQWNTLASGVDYLSVTPGKSGTPPKIAVAGSTTNQSLNLTAKGTGAVNITNDNTGLTLAGNTGLAFLTDPNGASNTIAIGQGALSSIGTISWGNGGNIAIGLDAMHALNDAGADNSVAIGSGAMGSSVTGTVSVAIGYGALASTTDGSFSVAIGYNACGSGTSIGCTAVGASAMQNATVGGTAFGLQALQHNQGNYNVAIGPDTLQTNTTGTTNIAIGDTALVNNTTGSDNIAIGYQALVSATTGGFNFAIGPNALFNLSSGGGNMAIGYAAGNHITTGNNNVLFGAGGTTLTTGSQNILLGDSSVDVPSAATSNWMNIGNAIYGYNLKNTTNGSGVTQIAIGTGVTSVTAGAVLDLSSNTTSTNSSLLLPVGTSAARPTGVNGMIRYNTTTNAVEGFVNGAWGSIGGGGSSNLGTSTAAASPQISGDATSGFYTPAASTVAVTAGGKEVVQWNTLASAVDYLSVTPGKSGTDVTMAVAGSTTNQSLDLTSKGTGTINITGANTGLSIASANAIRFPTSDTGPASSSIAIGSSALVGQTISADYENTAIGYLAMSGTLPNTAGDNTAVGWEAMKSNTGGNENTAVGNGALAPNTTGSNITAMGAGAMGNISSTVGNDVAIGTFTLQWGGGTNNTGVGYGVLGNASGTDNTGVGANAGGAMHGGAHNSIFGSQVGNTTLSTGNNNILIGTDGSTDTPLSSTSNWMNIGNAIYGYNLYNSTNTTGVPQIAIGKNLTSVVSGAALDLSSNTTSSNSSLALPIGTTAARPGTPTNGMIRYNSSIPSIEAYVNNAWTSLGNSGTVTPGGINTNVQFNNSGSLGGSGNFTWNNGSNTLTVTGSESISSKLSLGLTGGASAPTTLALSQLSGTSISSPSTNQCLVYNGTNWVNTACPTAAGTGINKVITQVFTTGSCSGGSSPCSYTPSANLLYAVVEVVGSGGGGGFANGAAGATGGGGGGGGYTRARLTATQINAGTITVTVGAGGAGGTSGGTAAVAGGNSSFNNSGSGGSVNVIANGGSGGTGGAAAGSQLGGVGGTAGSGGDFMGTGATGSNGVEVNTTANLFGGNGGSSTYGGGGQGGLGGAAGSNAAGYGAGGGGGSRISTTSRAGGNGSDGVVIITEYTQ